MRKKFKLISIISLVICLTFNSGYAFATEDSDSKVTKEQVDSLKQQADEATSNVNNIKGQKDEAEKNKSELESQANSLTGKISSLNSKITSVTEDINNTEVSIAQVEEDIELLNEQIEATQTSLESQREAMKLRIQFMYESQSTNPIIALLECGSITEMLARLEYMAQMTNYDQDCIAKFEATKAELEKTSAEVEAKRQELVAYQEELNNKKTELNSLVSSTKTALNDTNSKITESASAIAQLEDQLKQAEAVEASIRDAYLKAQLELAMSLAGEKGNYTGGYTSSDEETLLLAALIQAEAANQGDAGRLAVGSVVMNRVNSPKFPNSVAGVIYQTNQFAPVASGKVAIILSQGPNSDCQRAAAAALAGGVNTNALFFCTYSYAQKLDASQVAAGNAGFLSRTDGIQIKDHYFYNYK